MKPDESIGLAGAAPTVSVIMANFDGGRFIEAAIGSVLTQSLRDLELIVSDDASSDDSVSRAIAITARDARVRVLRSSSTTGPADARNRALKVARGRWLAVMDSDDLMHPERLERLVAAAERDGADIVADDLLAFADDGLAPPFTCLQGAAARSPQWLGIAQFIRSNAMYAGKGVLGYLKPVVSAALLARTGVRYDARLRINEDYDFALRLMIAGARYRVYPDLTYFYRRHGASTSHRISRACLESMLQSGDALRADLAACESGITIALDRWRRALVRAIAYDGIIAAVKRRDAMTVLRLLLRNPGAGALLRLPVTKRLKRIFTPEARHGACPRRICVISRDAIVGRKHVGSARLLERCRALRDSGNELDLVCPSPTVFGRWPVLALGPDRRLFRSIVVRGGWRVANVVVACMPAVTLEAWFGGSRRAAAFLGVGTDEAAGRANGSIGQRATREEGLFVARHARKAAAIIVDNAVPSDAIACALRPDAPSAVIIYDLSSRRPPCPGRTDTSAEATALERVAGITLPATSDSATTADTAVVRRALAQLRVIVAPPPAAPVARALCVGPDTASRRENSHPAPHDGTAGSAGDRGRPR